nr:hypothetical protein [Tanacetum cinerariifolium]
DQDYLNSATGGNLLERRTQDVLTIIKNKSKVPNSRNKSIVSQVKSSDANSSSSSKIAKLTHAVNQQTSVVTIAMTTVLNQFQATPHPASVKAIEEICVTCGAAVNYNQGNFGYRPLSVANQIRPSGFAQPNVQNDQNRFSQPQGYNRGNNFNQDTSYQALILQNQVVHLNPKLAGYTIKVPPPLVQKAKPPSQRNYVVNQRDPLHPNIPYPSRMYKEKQQDKALLSNTEKLLELENTPLNENFSAVILKKLPEKLRDPGKFLIPCGFSELKCKALADLANQATCTPAGIARDVFVLVGEFTFLADFVIVNYESDPQVPLIWRRPFLRIARALIDVHGEEMILHDGDERLTLNMRHETSSYSNQPLKESTNMININNDSHEDYLEDLFATNHLSGNPTFSSHSNLTSPKVINPLSGSTTSSSPDHLLEEFSNEFALITFPPRNDDLSFYIESDLREIAYLLNHDPTKEMDSILDDSV